MILGKKLQQAKRNTRRFVQKRRLILGLAALAVALGCLAYLGYSGRWRQVAA
jgi:hypothetical protein